MLVEEHKTVINLHVFPHSLPNPESSNTSMAYQAFILHGILNDISYIYIDTPRHYIHFLTIHTFNKCFKAMSRSCNPLGIFSSFALHSIWRKEMFSTVYIL